MVFSVNTIWLTNILWWNVFIQCKPDRWCFIFLMVQKAQFCETQTFWTLTPYVFWPKFFFDPKIFLAKHFFNQIFFGPKFSSSYWQKIALDQLPKLSAGYILRDSNISATTKQKQFQWDLTELYLTLFLEQWKQSCSVKSKVSKKKYKKGFISTTLFYFLSS